jgi:hypothetical protein
MSEKWIELTVPNYLKEFRKQVEKELKSENEVKITQSKIGRKKSIAVSATDAKNFLKEGINIIIQKFNGSKTVLDESILKDANQVLSSIKGEEELLENLVPNFSVNEKSRWPGQVGYRAIINHLVAVSIRVHSMHPSIDFDDVIRSVSRRVIVPALAHNLTFLRKDNRELFDFLLKSDNGLEKIKKGIKLSIKDIQIGKKTKSDCDDDAIKWVRLLNALRFFMSEIKNFHELVTEIQRLTLEHEINPNSSSLWSELSLIASGDLSVDEILVSKVTAELEITTKNDSYKPIISCARSRFGLLRYSYGMIEEKELILNKRNEALSRTKDYYEEIDKISTTGKIDDKTAIQGFGWAYLWSRYLLIKSGKHNKPRDTDLAAELIEKILSKLYIHSKNIDYTKLAVRYLAGFLTNPRFIRPVKFLENQTSATHWIKQMKEAGLPIGMISLMNARVSLHQAYEFRKSDPLKFKSLLEKSLSLYADTLCSINASVYSESMMDGEVSAWAIPEMRMCIELLKDTLTETGNHKRSLEFSLTSYQKALDTIGEMQFGVYFDKEDEESRLRLGLDLASNS